MYKLSARHSNVILEPLTERDTKEYTGKTLTGVETTSMDVLQYGRVAVEYKDLKVGDIVLYEKLAAHKTNFGNPRLLLVDDDHIQGRLEK